MNRAFTAQQSIAVWAEDAEQACESLRRCWTNTLEFLYDEAGKPVGVSVNGAVFEYITNLQGDILKVVYGGTGDVWAEYTYDAWGRVLTATGNLAAANPLRYRGYFYDTETNLYYVHNRYYDPQLCRWINADSLASTGQGFLGCNMFAYCGNNPVNKKDTGGKDAIWIQEADSAAGEGHSGLMAQDENGEWGYFYWGPETESFDGAMITKGVEHAAFWCRINVDDCDLSTDDGVIKAINQTLASKDRKNRASKITSTKYFVGDYSATAKKAKEIADSNSPYKLLNNNCVQNTISAFMESDWRFGLTIFGDVSDMIPNVVYSRVLLLSGSKADYPWVLSLMNLQ